RSRSRPAAPTEDAPSEHGDDGRHERERDAERDQHPPGRSVVTGRRLRLGDGRDSLLELRQRTFTSAEASLPTPRHGRTPPPPATAGPAPGGAEPALTMPGSLS